MVEAGAWVVGTPDDAIAAIERLQERSGGFGGLMVAGHEWAPPRGDPRAATSCSRATWCRASRARSRASRRPTRWRAPARPSTGEERVAAVEAAQRAYEVDRAGS